MTPVIRVFGTVVICYTYNDRITIVFCQKGPTRHAYAWQIGPFWQDILDILSVMKQVSPFLHNMTLHERHCVPNQRRLDGMFNTVCPGHRHRRHQNSAPLAICEGSPLVISEFHEGTKCGKCIHIVTSSYVEVSSYFQAYFYTSLMAVLKNSWGDNYVYQTNSRGPLYAQYCKYMISWLN